MGALGVVFGVLALTFCIGHAVLEAWKEAFICGIVALLFIALIVFDVTSPVEITERVVTTNDYDAYGLYVESDKLGNVRIVTKDSTRPLAIWHNGVERTFLSFVE